MADTNQMLATFNQFAQMFNKYFLDVAASSVAPPPWVQPRQVTTPVISDVAATSTPTITSITTPLTTAFGNAIAVRISGVNLRDALNVSLQPPGTATPNGYAMTTPSWDGLEAILAGVDFNRGAGTWTAQCTTTMTPIGPPFTFVVGSTSPAAPLISSITPATPDGGDPTNTMVIAGARFGAQPHVFLSQVGAGAFIFEGPAQVSSSVQIALGGSGATDGSECYLSFNFATQSGAWHIRISDPNTGLTSAWYPFTVS